MEEIKIRRPMETNLPWHIVEASISKEKKWLREVFDFSELKRTDHKNYDNFPISADEMLRQISTSIVRGDILVRELKSAEINGLWTSNKDWELEENEERHGGDWHQAMMGIVKKHFRKEGFEVVNEPNLNQGRADLGVYKDTHPNLFVEIGTTSLFKTWINLHNMPNTVFLFVPSVYYALEFKTQDFHPLKD